MLRLRSLIAEPFWPTLAALLALSLLTAVPFGIVAALLWPTSTSVWPLVGCYVVAVPVTWWLLREKLTAHTVARVWREWDRLDNNEPSPVKTVAGRLGLPMGYVARIVQHPPGTHGERDDSQEPPLGA